MTATHDHTMPADETPTTAAPPQGAIIQAVDWVFRFVALYCVVNWAELSRQTRVITLIYLAIQAVYLGVWLWAQYWHWQLRLAKRESARLDARSRERDAERILLIAEGVVLDEQLRILKPDDRTDEP